MKVQIYSRKAIEKLLQGDFPENTAVISFYDPPSKRTKVCTEYAERNKYTVIKSYSDSALTGKNDRRPALQRLISDCSNGTFDMVLVYSIDRFGRNLKQSLTMLTRLRKTTVYY